MGRKYGRLCIGRPGGCFRLKRTRRLTSLGSNATTAQTAEFLSDNAVNGVGGGTIISESLSNIIDDHDDQDNHDQDDDEKIIIGNKIMILVDSSIEAKGGLDWALSHTVQSQDTVVLLHVAKPSSKQDSNGKVNDLRATELLHSMKNMCERKKPGVKVVIELLRGKEKGPIVVEAAKRQKVSLLVIGQKRKRSIWWGLMMMTWTRKAKRRDAADYCVQNAQCMTIAVRRKNKKLGGYLITTKRHKNFWLLA